MVTGNKELVQSVFCQVAWSSPIVCDGWLCKSDVSMAIVIRLSSYLLSTLWVCVYPRSVCPSCEAETLTLDSTRMLWEKKKHSYRAFFHYYYNHYYQYHIIIIITILIIISFFLGGGGGGGGVADTSFS